MSPKISASKGARGAAKLHRAVGPSPERAPWLAVEVETLARQYHGCPQIGNPPPLPSEAIEQVRQNMAGYRYAHSGKER